MNPYEEYTVELNGNALTIRVLKDSSYRVSIGEDSNSCYPNIKCFSDETKTLLQIPEHPYSIPMDDDTVKQITCINRFSNGSNLSFPIIRGNLKYPCVAEKSIDFEIDRKNRKNRIEQFLKGAGRQRNVCMQTLKDPESKNAPEGLELCQKGWHDPNTDVFVLKLGKSRNSEDDRNQIELELRTPKGPNTEKRPKETRACQVVEEEFEPLVKKQESPASKTKKPKTKGKAKKGKKVKK